MELNIQPPARDPSDPNQQPASIPSNPTPPNPMQPNPATQPYSVIPAQQAVPMTTPAPTQPAFTPPAPVTPSFNTNSSDGKKLLPLLVAVGVVIIIAAAFGAYVLLMSPSTLSKKASTAFMNAATTGNKEKLYILGDATTADDKAFLDHSADSVKGSYKLSESKGKDGKWYYLYTLSGGARKYARTVAEKKDGKWYITSFDFSDTHMALIPGTGAVINEPTTAAAPSTSSNCLIATDFDAWYQAMYKQSASGQGFRYDKLETAYYTNTHFNADSLNVDEDNTNGVSSMVDLAKAVGTKQFKIRLYGSTATVAKSDADFANKRAEAVKAKLVAGGVDAIKIVIDAPKNVSDTGAALNDEVAKRSSRVVVLTFDPTCTDSAASSSAR